MRLIAPDAVFVESGKIETRAEYEANHLPADVDFERHVKAMRGPLRVTFDGRDTAWVISRAEYDYRVACFSCSRAPRRMAGRP